jgi:hypothetical protein
MATTNPMAELITQSTTRAVEAFTMLAEANQKILRELVDLSASTAKEGVRLYAELQSSAVEAAKDGQAFMLRRQAELGAPSRDPMGCVQAGLLESVDGTQKAWRLIEGNAQAITRSAERLHATADQTGKEIQGTLTQLSGRVKSLYAPLP